MATDIEVAYLADHPQHVETISQWLQDEFGYLAPEITLEDTIARFRSRMVKDRVPLALIALQGREVIGTISLKQDEPFTRDGLTPWVGGAVVREDKRGLGVGEKLLAKLEAIAAELGYPAVYLSASDAEGFYAKNGWQTTERVSSLGEDVALMRKTVL